MLDGEIIAGAGLPSEFYGIAGLMSARGPKRPLWFVAFDVLHLNGRSVLGYDQASRRDVLDRLAALPDGALVTVNRFPGDDLDAALDCCTELAMEGVVVISEGAFRVKGVSP